MGDDSAPFDLQVYLEEARAQPLLTREDQGALEARLVSGNEAARAAARDRLARTNMRLVVSIARKYEDELALSMAVRRGHAGLVRAIERFDPSRGFKFSIYATWWIRSAMEGRGPTRSGPAWTGPPP